MVLALGFDQDVCLVEVLESFAVEQFVPRL